MKKAAPILKFRNCSLEQVQNYFRAKGFTVDGLRAESRCRNQVWTFNRQVALRVV